MEEEKRSQKDHNDLVKRVNRVEGQVKGIRRMIEEEEDCVAILTQIAAARAAINKVGAMILDEYVNDCIRKSTESPSKEQEIKKMTDSVQKFLKFID